MTLPGLEVTWRHRLIELARYPLRLRLFLLLLSPLIVLPPAFAVSGMLATAEVLGLPPVVVA